MLILASFVLFSAAFAAKFGCVEWEFLSIRIKSRMRSEKKDFFINLVFGVFDYVSRR